MKARKGEEGEESQHNVRLLEAFGSIIDFAVCLKEENVFLLKIQD